jgi:glutamate 5-kinase
MNINKNKKRLIIKIGTTTLTQGLKKISRGKLEDIANQIKILQNEYEIIVVSSGAIAAAKQFVELNKGKSIEVKQALAAIGQLHLMRIYQEVFGDFNLQCAQCLLTYHDFDNMESRKNVNNTISTLLVNGYIPIINENDTVATEEIQFGDNDKLAALTAELVGADLLVLVTDIDGLYTKDPKEYSDAEMISTINNLKPFINGISDSKSDLGSGGMKSKLESAEIAQLAGIETWILSGSQPNFLINAMQDKLAFTRILAGQ